MHSSRSELKPDACSTAATISVFVMTLPFPVRESNGILFAYTINFAEQRRDCPYIVRTDIKKAPSYYAKCLIHNYYLVGDASFELATPAV